MTQQFYTQCRLERKTERGVKVLFSWLPKKYAVIGKHLQLKEVEGWKVTNAWETCTEEEVKKRCMLYKHWREMTDV